MRRQRAARRGAWRVRRRVVGPLLGPLVGLGLGLAFGPGAAVADGHRVGLPELAGPGAGQGRGSAPISGPTRDAEGAPPLDANAKASFARLKARLSPEARIAIAIEPFGAGATEVLGGDPAMQAMSTSKVLILSALLLDRGGVKHFTAVQKSLARTAITQSDNASILSLFGDLEADKGGLAGASAYATSLLRKAGDDRTHVSTSPPPPGYVTTFGQTRWTPTAEVTFFRALARGCVVPRPDAEYELRLMREIEPAESWGLGSAGFAHVAFKGGWGPEPHDRYGVRQTGLIGHGNSAVVVSIAADPAATFTTGQSALDRIARWLRREIRLVPRSAVPCSG
jgi:hypothetical protein